MTFPFTVTHHVKALTPAPEVNVYAHAVAFASTPSLLNVWASAALAKSHAAHTTLQITLILIWHSPVSVLHLCRRSFSSVIVRVYPDEPHAKSRAQQTKGCVVPGSRSRALIRQGTHDTQFW